jgi:hypothetical protein
VEREGEVVRPPSRRATKSRAARDKDDGVGTIEGDSREKSEGTCEGGRAAENLSTLRHEAGKNFCDQD